MLDRSLTKQGNIKVLVQALDEVFAGVSKDVQSIELILVDDGSSDDTWNSINDECIERVDYLYGIRLARNFGHQSALLAGLKNCNGDVIVTLDGDLQHPPSTISELLAKWSEGYNVVNTERLDQNQSSVFERLSSYWFYRIFSRLTSVQLNEGNSDFRLMDWRVLNTLLSFDDVRMFFRGAVSWVGFKRTTVSYQLQPRFSGETKYSLKKMFQFAGNAMLSFSTIPRIGNINALLTLRRKYLLVWSLVAAPPDW